MPCGDQNGFRGRRNCLGPFSAKRGTCISASLPPLRLKSDSWVESNSKASSPLGESTLSPLGGKLLKALLLHSEHSKFAVGLTHETWR